MLYVVLIAMLAINISEEVLGGFETARDDFSGNIEKQRVLNEALITKLKNTEIEENALEMKNSALNASKDFEIISNSIKESITAELFSSNTVNNGDLSSVKKIMLDENNPKAEVVKKHMDNIRTMCMDIAKDDAVKEVIGNMLATDDSKGNWNERHFKDVPVIGADMMLKKAELEIWTAMNLALTNALDRQPADSIQDNGKKTDGIDADKDILDKLAAEIAKKLYAQNMNIDKNEKELQTLVMTEHKAPLFAGFENRVKIMTFSNEKNGNEVKVTADNGKVRKEGDDYIVIPETNAEMLTLKVTSGNRTMAEYEYNVIPLPMPKPVLVYTALNGENREYTAEVPLTKKELLSIREIKLKFAGNVDTKESVAGFDIMVIKGKTNETVIKHATGNSVNSEMRNVLDKLERGDKLVFMNIEAKGKLTGSRKLVSINVTNM